MSSNIVDLDIDRGITSATTLGSQLMTTDEKRTIGGGVNNGIIYNASGSTVKISFGSVHKPIAGASNAEEKLFLVRPKLTNRFVSRVDILEKVLAAIQSNRSKGVCMPVVLKGIGGMGKSELMLKYCYQYRKKYSYIFWLDVDGCKATTDAFRGLAMKLGIDIKADDSRNEDVLIERIRGWLDSRTGWLLLLDNMDSKKDVDDYIPRTGGDVIITTRNHVSSSWATVIKVDKMTNEEALLLLGSHSPSDNVAPAKAIVQELDCFPLAINIARSYIKSTEILPISYLKLIKQKPQVLLTSRGDVTPDRYKEKVATVGNLSFQKIQERSPLAKRILDVLAFLQPDAIPASLFQRQHDALALFRKKGKKPLEPVDDVNSAIGVLVEFSFVRRNTSDDIGQGDNVNSDDNSEPVSDILAIHRLVQSVVRDRVRRSESLGQLEHIVAALSREVVSVEYHHSQIRKANEVHLPHVRRIVEWQNNWGPMAPKFQNLLIALLGRTVRYLINSGTLQGIEEYARMSLLISTTTNGFEHPSTVTTLDDLAWLYRSQGKYDEATPLYQLALAISEKVLGPEDPNTTTLLSNLADLYRNQGKHDEAEPLYQRALPISEKMFGPEHPDTAAILNNLADLYQSRGKYDEAELLYARGLAIREKALGSQHPDTAMTLSNLAMIYQIQGKYDMAEPLYQRSLAIYEKLLGPEHPKTAATLNHLAGLYGSQGKYDEVEPLYQQALAISEKVLGPEHPYTAITLNHLAELYQRQGKYDEAEPLYQRGLAIIEKMLGPEHLDTATTLNSLALLYQSQGKHDEAEPLYQRGLAIREKVLGPEHPDTATTLNNLALLYGCQGKYDEAGSLYQRSLAIHEKVLGPEHPVIAAILNNLAGLYESQGKYDEAEPLYQRGLAIREKLLGPEHPDTTTILSNLALLYKSQGKHDEAEPLYQRGLAIREKVLGPEHPEIATTLNNLALLYENQGRYDEAEPLYQRALAIDEKVLEAQHPETATTLNNLAGLYESQGKYDEAEPLYQRALAIDENVLRPEHPDTAISLNNLARLYKGKGKYDEAEELYQRALRIYDKALGPAHPHIASTRRNLADLHDVKVMKKLDKLHSIKTFRSKFFRPRSQQIKHFIVHGRHWYLRRCKQRGSKAYGHHLYLTRCKRRS